MTTTIIITNDENSNPLQHAVIVKKNHDGSVKETLLGPGEAHTIWLHSHESVTVREAFSEKPGYRHPHRHVNPDSAGHHEKKED